MPFTSRWWMPATQKSSPCTEIIQSLFSVFVPFCSSYHLGLRVSCKHHPDIDFLFFRSIRGAFWTCPSPYWTLSLELSDSKKLTGCLGSNPQGCRGIIKLKFLGFPSNNVRILVVTGILGWGVYARDTFKDRSQMAIFLKETSRELRVSRLPPLDWISNIFLFRSSLLQDVVRNCS